MAWKSSDSRGDVRRALVDVENTPRTGMRGQGNRTGRRLVKPQGAPKFRVLFAKQTTAQQAKPSPLSGLKVACELRTARRRTTEHTHNMAKIKLSDGAPLFASAIAVSPLSVQPQKFETAIMSLRIHHRNSFGAIISWLVWMRHCQATFEPFVAQVPEVGELWIARIQKKYPSIPLHGRWPPPIQHAFLPAIVQYPLSSTYGHGSELDFGASPHTMRQPRHGMGER